MDFIALVARSRDDFVHGTTTKCARCRLRPFNITRDIAFLKTFAYNSDEFEMDHDIKFSKACANHYDEWFDSVMASKCMVLFNNVNESLDGALLLKDILRQMAIRARGYLSDVCFVLLSEFDKTPDSPQRPKVSIDSFPVVHVVKQYECCVCWSNNKLVMLGCAHSVCETCFTKILEKSDSCPYCRCQIDTTTCKRFVDKIIFVDS